MPVRHAQLLFDAAGEPKELWRLPGVAHVGAYFADRGEYVHRVTSFFRSALGGRPFPPGLADVQPSSFSTGNITN